MKIFSAFILFFSGCSLAFSQADTLSADLVPLVNEEYAFYQYDSSLQDSILYYNYTGLWDLDGDKIKDSLILIGNGGAHAYFHLCLVLSADGVKKEFHWIQIDQPYLLNIESLGNFDENSVVQFHVKDFDSDGDMELYFNIKNTNLIPVEWKLKGVNSGKILIDFSDGKVMIRNFKA